MMFDYTQWLPSISLANLESTHASFIFITNHFYQRAHFPGLKKQNKIKLKQNRTGFLQCTSLAPSPFLYSNVLKTGRYLLPLSSVLYWTHVNRICSLFGKKLQSGYEVFPQRYVWQKIGSREGSGTLKRQNPVKRNWTTGTCPWRTSPVSFHSGFLLHGYLSWGYAEEHNNRSWTKISKTTSQNKPLLL